MSDTVVETEEEKEIHDADVQTVAFCMLIVVLLLGYCYHNIKIFKRIETFFPHASANMVFGVIIGAIIASIGDLNSVFSFSSEFFFVYLLPPIIFSAGFNVPKDYFFHNFGSIITFAFVGTTMSAFLIGSLLYAVGQLDIGVEKLDFTMNMEMGSLISAVDPVAVILVLKSLSVDEQLKVILFGESVLNDAAAVVINRVFVSIEDEEKTALEALGPAIPQIIGVAVASILIGCVIALIVAYVHKNTQLRQHPNIEMAVFLIGALVPYALAEALDLSGIMAVLFAGIMADYYTYHHLSKDCKYSTRTAISAMSFLAEGFVFVYLGMSFFLETAHVFQAGYVFLTLFLCFLGRAVSVFPLAFLLNKGRKHQIPVRHQLVLWWAGLRGPVAYALALATPENAASPKDNNLIVSTTLIVVAITTFVLGGLAFPFIKSVKPPLMESTRQSKTDTYDISNHWFSKLDRRFLSPYFGPKRRDRDRPEKPLSESHIKMEDELAMVGSDSLAHGGPSGSSTDPHLLSHAPMGHRTRTHVSPHHGAAVIGTAALDHEAPDEFRQEIALAVIAPRIMESGEYSNARTAAPSFVDNPRERSASNTWSENNPSRSGNPSTRMDRLEITQTSELRSVTPPPTAMAAKHSRDKL